jgi:oligopeptide transport system substrate-binding protein
MESLDARTLRLRLDEPRAYMLYLLAQLPFFPWPRHRVESLGDEWRAPAALVSNGPFALREVGEERSVLTADPQWRRPRGNVVEVAIEKGLPPEVFEEWRANRHDVLFVPGFVPGRSRKDVVHGERDTVTLPIPLPSTQFVAFPARSPFDDERIRKALAYALDRDLLVEGTDEQPARGGFLPPSMPGHSHDLAPKPDLARARALLAQAGYADGRGLPELRLMHADFGFSEAFRREVGARWEPQWRELGVRVRQEWVPAAALASEANADDTFWEWGWGTDYPDPHGMLASFLESQPVGHDDERARLVGLARSLRSRDDRLQLYRDADRRLVVEQAWVVPTIYDKWHLLHRPWLQGLWTSPLGISTMDEVVVRR